MYVNAWHQFLTPLVSLLPSILEQTWNYPMEVFSAMFANRKTLILDKKKTAACNQVSFVPVMLFFTIEIKIEMSTDIFRHQFKSQTLPKTETE